MSQESAGASAAAGRAPQTHPVVENAQSPMSPEYRDLVQRIVYDNWLAEAANASLKYHEVCCPLHLAPAMEDRAVLAVYWADECRHSVMFAMMLRDLGAEPAPEDYEAVRPAELLRLPVTTWAEHGLFQLFADSAGGVHLADYAESSYLPLRATATEIARDEARHIALGMKNIVIAMATAEGRAKILEVLPAWYAAAMQMFGRVDRPSRRAQAAVAAGIRKQDNAHLLDEYKTNIDRRLTRLGLPIPG